MRAVAFHEGEPQVAALGSMPPSGLLRYQLEDLRVTRFSCQQLQAKLQRIPGESGRQLVHGAFDRKAVRGVTDRAHVTHVDPDLLANITQAEVGYGIGKVLSILDHRIEGILVGRIESRGDRGTSDVECPGDELPLIVKAGADFLTRRRPEAVMRHVIFTRPD